MSDADALLCRMLHQGLSGSVVLWAMVALSVLGSGWTMFAFLPLLVIPKSRRFGVALVAVLTTAAVVVFVLKHLVRRTRPYLLLSDVHPRVFAPPVDFSFPSGHATGGFAFAAFVATVLLGASEPGTDGRTKAWLLSSVVFLLATGIGLSRIALGVHFPIDVLGGAVIGLTAGTIGGRIYLRSSQKALP